MSETVNEIQNRLHPRNMASNAADSIKETAAERTGDIVDSEPVQYVRANPIPTAMIGVGIAGLAWLAFGGRETSHVRHRSRYARAGSSREPGSYGDDEYYRTGASRPATSTTTARTARMTRRPGAVSSMPARWPIEPGTWPTRSGTGLTT